jgi:hypothetical protein
VIVLLAVGACDDASPDAMTGPAFVPAATNTTVTDIPMDFTTFVPCTGEEVRWTGTVHSVHHTTTNRGVVLGPDQFQHESTSERGRLTGIGQISGDTYLLNTRFHFSGQAESPVNEFPAVVRITLRDRVFGPSGNLGVADFRISLVINGSGDVVFDRGDFDFTMECR